MAEVSLNVYDVTKNLKGPTNIAIVTLNNVTRDRIGVGGIFHGAIEVYDKEWSFGFCREDGSGVFSCPPKRNAEYKFRETVPLGHTTCSRLDVTQIVTEMSREWQANTYDMLTRNCNHFCEAFAARLGVEKLPPWLNRFAEAGDAAVEVAGLTMEKLKQATAKTGDAAVEVAGVTMTQLKQANAKTGDVAVKVAGLTVERLKQAKAGVTTAAHRYLVGDRPTSSGANSDSGSPNASRSGSNNNSSSSM